MGSPYHEDCSGLRSILGPQMYRNAHLGRLIKGFNVLGWGGSQNRGPLGPHGIYMGYKGILGSPATDCIRRMLRNTYIPGLIHKLDLLSQPIITILMESLYRFPKGSKLLDPLLDVARPRT